MSEEPTYLIDPEPAELFESFSANDSEVEALRTQVDVARYMSLLIGDNKPIPTEDIFFNRLLFRVHQLPSFNPSYASDLSASSVTDHFAPSENPSTTSAVMVDRSSVLVSEQTGVSEEDEEFVRWD